MTTITNEAEPSTETRPQVGMSDVDKLSLSDIQQIPSTLLKSNQLRTSIRNRLHTLLNSVEIHQPIMKKLADCLQTEETDAFDHGSLLNPRCRIQVIAELAQVVLQSRKISEEEVKPLRDALLAELERSCFIQGSEVTSQTPVSFQFKGIKSNTDTNANHSKPSNTNTDFKR